MHLLGLYILETCLFKNMFVVNVAGKLKQNVYSHYTRNLEDIRIKQHRVNVSKYKKLDQKYFKNSLNNFDSWIISENLEKYNLIMIRFFILLTNFQFLSP